LYQKKYTNTVDYRNAGNCPYYQFLRSLEIWGPRQCSSRPTLPL